MTAPAGVVFEGFGDHAPLDLDAGPHAARDILARIHHGTWDAFADTAAAVGYCSHPVRLSGSTTRIDAHTGEVLSHFRSTDQPLGALYQRCGNRRASVCPACSRVCGGQSAALPDPDRAILRPSARAPQRQALPPPPPE